MSVKYNPTISQCKLHNFVPSTIDGHFENFWQWCINIYGFPNFVRLPKLGTNKKFTKQITRFDPVEKVYLNL